MATTTGGLKRLNGRAHAMAHQPLCREAPSEGSAAPQGAAAPTYKNEWTHNARSPAEEGPGALLAFTLGTAGPMRQYR
ncbi:hypothetical protein NDU88_000776 [Pleurodeles waltl]|uniref:Uncharacterized protein n=1 Tax=Pleurodeles waltl TaxID=8319 RepID=A0AAV7TFX5_PLEWA|nr:hypothetical protein NDU88_000776 [Pleurodeles waltl]